MVLGGVQFLMSEVPLYHGPDRSVLWQPKKKKGGSKEGEPSAEAGEEVGEEVEEEESVADEEAAVVKVTTQPRGKSYLESISHRCYLFEVAFVWELTKETISLPLGCLQGGLQSFPVLHTKLCPLNKTLRDTTSKLYK